MIKKTLFLFLLTLLLIIVLNLSPLNIPTDKSKYEQYVKYFKETEELFGLSRYQQNDFGMGMTGSHNDMILLKDVNSAFDLLLNEIEKAEKNINIEIFIIRNDQTGKHFKNLLIEKAKQGVEIRLLYDAWGSALTSRSYFNDLRKNGIKISSYNPLLSSFMYGHLNNRLHRKMIIIDGKKAFIGGQNIGDEYLGKDKEIGFWKDTAIIFKGDAALSIQQIFLNDWLQSSGEKIVDSNFYPRIESAYNKTAKIIVGGPDSPQTEMNLSYISLINNAKNKILIISPYLFPDPAILDALYAASARNIDIHLILPGKSDSRIAEIANKFYMNKLLAHGIKISTYNRGFIHSKIMIIDNIAASVGTANLSELNLWENYEVIAIIYDQNTIQQLNDDFINNLKDSTNHNPKTPASDKASFLNILSSCELKSDNTLNCIKAYSHLSEE